MKLLFLQVLVLPRTRVHKVWHYLELPAVQSLVPLRDCSDAMQPLFLPHFELSFSQNVNAEDEIHFGKRSR